MYKLDLEKGEMNQMSTCQHSLDHRQSNGIPESIYFCFIDYGQAFDFVDPTNWKILKKMGITDHLTCLLRKLYAGQEATVSTRHGAMDWFKIGKGVMSRLHVITLLI